MNSELETLYNNLKNLQEPKGYYFNPDKEKVFELLEGLVVNKKRYGYMTCPCRLASGDIAKDRDIICPCIYRELDVIEFGSCYCGLYVSIDVIKGDTKILHVPERRPAEKFFI